MPESPRDKLSPQKLRNGFISALLGGTGAAALTTFLPGGSTFVIVGPITAMALYITYYHLHEVAPSVRDQFADSLYYLGFLFTIVALMASLVAYGLGGSAWRAEDVLARFGMALATTLVGLGGRVFYSHFETDVDYAEADTQQSLTERVNAFTLELAHLTERLGEEQTSFQEEIRRQRDALESFSKEIFGRANEAIEATHQKSLQEMESFSQQALQTQEGAIQGVGKRLEESVEDLSRRIQSVEVPADLLGEDMRSGVSEVNAATRELTQTITQLKRTLTETEKRWQSHWGSLDELERPVDQLGNLGEAMERIRAGIEGMENSLGRLQGEVRQLEQEHASARERLREEAQTTETLKQSLKQDVQEIAKLREQLQGELREATEASRSMHRAIAEGSQFIVSKLDGGRPTTLAPQMQRTEQSASDSEN